MLSQPASEALVAIEQVTKLPRWNDIEKMFDAELTTILDRILGAREAADLHELRGRAKSIREFQQLVRDAPAMLAKLGLRSPIE